MKGFILFLVAIVSIGIAYPAMGQEHKSRNVSAISVLGDSSVDCGANTLFYPIFHLNLYLLPCHGSTSILLPYLLANKMSLPYAGPLYTQNGTTTEGLLSGINYGAAHAKILSPNSLGHQSLNHQPRQVFETVQLLELRVIRMFQIITEFEELRVIRMFQIITEFEELRVVHVASPYLVEEHRVIRMFQIIIEFEELRVVHVATCCPYLFEELRAIRMFQITIEFEELKVVHVATWSPYLYDAKSLAFEFPWLVSTSIDKLALIDVRKFLIARRDLLGENISNYEGAALYDMDSPQRMLHGSGFSFLSVNNGAERIVCAEVQFVRKIE